MVVLVIGMRMRLKSDRETKAISGVNMLFGSDNTNVINDIKDTCFGRNQDQYSSFQERTFLNEPVINH